MNPRIHQKILLVLQCLVCVTVPWSFSRAAGTPAVEQWGIFEITLAGPTNGNPFIEVNLSARFTRDTHSVEVAGFYDGDGVYRIRFMPEKQGEWRYKTKSNRRPLNGKTGAFTVTAPAANNHGPVRVTNTYHFAYADGTPFRQLGTTSYGWTHQNDGLEEQTLQTLAAAPFNKIRMCVFPTSESWNQERHPRALPVCRPAGQSVGFHPFQSNVFSAPRKARRPVARPRHRGGRDSVSSLRQGPLGF